MSSDITFVNFVTDQMKDAGLITYRNMMGEYVIYYDEKIIGLVCDNKLFIKPTANGKAFIGEVTETSPYCENKLYFLIKNEIDDPQWVSNLVKITADELQEAGFNKE